MLHTQGYSTSAKPDSLVPATLATVLNGNHIEIEYRYFGTSLPEPFENLEFNYLNSMQASEDYHAIVTALKGSGRFKGQWLATGTSKSGIADLLEYIMEHPKATTRAKTEAEMLKFRKEDPGWAYYIQAMLELGHFRPYFDDLKPYLELTAMDLIISNDEGLLYKDYPTYAARFSDVMTKDFITNFLPQTTKKMIFVYGENDPWTGCAIPDPTNPNVQKIIVPKGSHNDFINNEYYCPKETYQQIMAAIRKYIK